MALPTVHRRSLKEREAKRVRGAGAGPLSSQAHRSITAGPRAPPDGRIILNKRLMERKIGNETGSEEELM